MSTIGLPDKYQHVLVRYKKNKWIQCRVICHIDEQCFCVQVIADKDPGFLTASLHVYDEGTRWARDSWF